MTTKISAKIDTDWTLPRENLPLPRENLRLPLENLTLPLENLPLYGKKDN